MATKKKAAATKNPELARLLEALDNEAVRMRSLMEGYDDVDYRYRTIVSWMGLDMARAMNDYYLNG